LELTRTPGDRRLYALASVGSIRFQGLVSRTAASCAGHRRAGTRRTPRGRPSPVCRAWAAEQANSRMFAALVTRERAALAASEAVAAVRTGAGTTV